MSERLPLPPDPLPLLRSTDVFRPPAGAHFGRVFFRGGAHPGAWDTFRSFGPIATMRFDHFVPDTGPHDHPNLGISYVAPAKGRHGRKLDPLETCVVETFQSTRVIDARAGEPWFVLWRSARVLTLLDVVDSPWITRTGGNGAISSGARAASRRWARAIYGAYPDVDGIFAGSSVLPGTRTAALFERAMDAVPTSYELALPLTHAGLRPALQRIAAQFDFGLLL